MIHHRELRFIVLLVVTIKRFYRRLKQTKSTRLHIVQFYIIAEITLEICSRQGVRVNRTHMAINNKLRTYYSSAFLGLFVCAFFTTSFVFGKLPDWLDNSYWFQSLYLLLSFSAFSFWIFLADRSAPRFSEAKVTYTVGGLCTVAYSLLLFAVLFLHKRM